MQSIASPAPEVTVLKNVLVCFESSKRPVSFIPGSDPREERKSFFKAFVLVYKDVFDVKSFDQSTVLLQIKSEDWGGEFIDIVEDDSIIDRAVLRVVQMKAKEKQEPLALRATSIACQLSKPKETEAQVLGRLFPSSSSRKRQIPPFNPSNESCSSSSQSKKKAFESKGRAVNVQVLMLHNMTHIVPRGKHRTKLKNSGRIQQIKVTRSMTAAEVSQQIERAFGHLALAGWQVLDCIDTTLSLSRNQLLDGSRATARKGSLYLCQTEAISIRDDSDEELPPVTVEQYACVKVDASLDTKETQGNIWEEALKQSQANITQGKNSPCNAPGVFKEGDNDIISSQQNQIEGTTITTITGCVEPNRIAYLKSIQCVHGRQREVNRSKVYEDVLVMFSDESIVSEYPLFIKFSDEMAVDEGGVQRDMFSAFLVRAYQVHFDGAKTLIPMIHPDTDMTTLSVIGRVISHGYLASGILPVRIALPSLIAILLGSQATISTDILMDAFADYLSEVERQCLKSAMQQVSPFTEKMNEMLIGILSRFGCRQIPKPGNIHSLILRLATYEFCTKPAAAISLMHSGIPSCHQAFWDQVQPVDIKNLCQQLSVTPSKVLAMLDFPELTNEAQARVSSYFTTFVGNMPAEELKLLLRFVTGASVCVSPKIQVTFNALSGLSRRPIAHTCDSTLELPVDYMNYDDFVSEFKAIFNATKDEFAWSMDAL